jgi:3-oxoacid CoA-transferase A subunit
MVGSKIYNTCAEAIADIPDGASIMIGGFAFAADKPIHLIQALREKGTKNLTLISNTPGAMGKLGVGSVGGRPYIDEEILIENGQVKKSICSLPSSVVRSRPNTFERLFNSGKIELELVLQGTLGERIRAGGAGIGAFYIPTGVGTAFEHGKEKKIINGREMLLEYALTADFALIKAYRADTMGNLVYRGIMRSFSPLMATAARITIVEAEEIVEAGELDAEDIITPGLYIKRIVRAPMEAFL